MREIPVKGGVVAFVDDEDYERLSAHKWCMSSGYAMRTESFNKPDGRRTSRTYYMHREVLGMRKGEGRHVDHRDRNRLNNQKANLRPATIAENQWNVGVCARNTSGLKGARWVPAKKKWESRIRYNGKRVWLGFFDTAELAHEFYCLAADLVHGEFVNHG